MMTTFLRRGFAIIAIVAIALQASGQQLAVNTTQNVVASEGQSVELACNVYTLNVTNTSYVVVTEVLWYRSARIPSPSDAEILLQFNETSATPLGAFAARVAGFARELVYVMRVTELLLADEGRYYCNVSGYFNDTYDNQTASTSTFLTVLKKKHCASAPCQTGMVCSEGVGNYTCACPQCYTGPTCSEQMINECLSNPCSNGGTCVDLCFKYSCNCSIGYRGVTCDEGCDNIASISGASSVRLGGTQAVRCTPSTAGAVVSWSRHSSGRPVAHTGEVYVVDGALARHAGFYFCLVTAAGCTSRWDTHVNVLWHIDPNTTDVLNVSLTIGDSFTESCNANSTPTAMLAWYWKTTNGSSLSDVIETAHPIGGNTTTGAVTLHLSDVQPGQAGLYTCVARLAADVTYTLKSITIVVSDDQLTSSSSSSSGGMPPWQLAVIVGGCLLALIIIIVVIVFCIKKKSVVSPSDKGPAEISDLDSKPHQFDEPKYSEADDNMNNAKKSPNIEPVMRQPKGGAKTASRDIFTVETGEPRKLPDLPSGRGGMLPPLDGLTSPAHKRHPMSPRAVPGVTPRPIADVDSTNN